MENKIYLLDEDTIDYFSGLIPADPGKWIGPDRLSFGMMYSDKPAGILTVTVNDISISLNWVYVRKEFRNMGLGTELVLALTDNTGNLSRDGYIHTACDEETKEFFEKNGFEFSDDMQYPTYMTRLEEMAELGLPKADDSVIGLHELSKRDLYRIQEQLLHEPDLALGVDLPFSVQDYMPESAACIRDEKVKALLFLEEIGNTINIAYAYEAENDIKSLFKTIAYSLDRISGKYEEETPITATALNERAGVLFSQVFGEAEKITTYHGKMRSW